MENIKSIKKNRLKTNEEEREYWEARGPLAKGARGRVNQPISKENRSSFLSIRLSGKEITQLRDLANRYNLGPSTFAREVLIALIGKAETLKNINDNQHTKTILFGDLFEALMKKTSVSFREQIGSLILSSTKGELDNPSSIVIDKTKIREWMEMSVYLISRLAETANPDIKVITPFDSSHEKAKLSNEKEGADKQVEV